MSLVKKSLSVVVVFMLGTLISYANVKVISKNTKAVKVVFENVQKNHPLTIIDAEGVVLHKENVSNNGHLVKFFDFSSLNPAISDRLFIKKSYRHINNCYIIKYILLILIVML